MTRGEMRAWIRRQAREMSAVAVTDAELNLYVDEAYEDIAARTACLRRDVEVVVSAATDVVKLPQYVTAVIQSQIKNSTPLLTARATDLESLLGTDWRTESGTIQYILPLGPATFRVAPLPSGTTVLEFYSSVVPAKAAASGPITFLVADGEEPQIPSAFHIALPYFVMREISIRDATNPEQQRRASEYAALYAASLETLRASTATLEGGIISLPILGPPQAGA